MKIIIPMTGVGARFQAAGYADLKPLINVHGKPIIEYVTELFPGEDDFVFVCREDHLRDTEMRTVLQRLKPNAEIVGITGHKLGPVHAVSQVFDRIPDNGHCIINYCDFFMNWDYADFKKTVTSGNYDGAIPSYTGFHPHLLPEGNVYAGCRVDENNLLLEIREKYSFTADKSQSHHSAGTYHFASGELLKHYCQHLIDAHLTLNGEYYASMVYQPMVEDGKRILVYDKIPHFCQWGTPQDLEEYLYWGGIFAR